MDRVSRSFFKPVVTSQADFHAASPSEWQLACQREAVIRPLAEADRLSCLQVDRAAKILGLGRRRECLPQLLGELGKTIPLPRVSGAVESTD